MNDGKAGSAIVAKPYEIFYRVNARVSSKENPGISIDTVAWRKDAAEAEKVFREASALSLLTEAGKRFGWHVARRMTVEKKLTSHVFNHQGNEIPKHEILLLEESKTWEDLDCLSIENARMATIRIGGVF